MWLRIQKKKKKSDEFSLMAGERAGLGDSCGVSYFAALWGWTSVAVMGGFCWGCVWLGAVPDFPRRFALTSS